MNLDSADIVTLVGGVLILGYFFYVLLKDNRRANKDFAEMDRKRWESESESN